MCGAGVRRVQWGHPSFRQVAGMNPEGRMSADLRLEYADFKWGYAADWLE